MASDYEAVDHALVVGILDAGTYTASSANFLGLFEAHRPPPEEDLSPTRPPKIFALWQLEPQETIETFGDVRPLLRYALVVEIHRQKGAGRGYVYQLLEEIRDALKTGAAGITTQWKQGQATPIGTIGNSLVEQAVWTLYGGTN